MSHNCPSCGSSDGDIFYRAEGAPANGLPVSSRAEAVAVARGDILLTFCAACGFVFNAAFDPALADVDCLVEDTSSFAAHEAFQERLVNHLSERYALVGKDILDVGGRNSELVAQLCERGRNHRIGLALGRVPEPLVAGGGTAAACGPEAIAVAAAAGPVDLLCCTMLLEHCADPGGLLRALRGVVALRREARLFLQVSNFTRTLKNFAFWEIAYQACSYFSPGFLHRLLGVQGFAVDEVWTDFDGQYLMADAHAAAVDDRRPLAQANVETIADLADLVVRFAHECREKQAMWCEILRKLAAAGNRIAIWGAGVGAGSFLTTLAVGDEVSYVIDVSPSRQGKYMAGTGHRIVAPDGMVAMRPDVVIVMNSALTFEIRDLLAKAGCAPTLLIA